MLSSPEDELYALAVTPAEKLAVGVKLNGLAFLQKFITEVAPAIGMGRRELRKVADELTAGGMSG
jgi:hypothetical protein